MSRGNTQGSPTVEKIKDALGQLRDKVASLEERLAPPEVQPVTVVDPDYEPVGDEDGDHPASGSEAETRHYRRLAREGGYRFCEAGDLLPLLDVSLSQHFTREWQDKERVLPILLEEGTLLVASDAPGRGQRRLRRRTGASEVEYRVVTPTAFRRIRWAIDLGELPRIVSPEADTEGEDDLLSHDLRAGARSVALFESVLVDAVGARASDLHLEMQPRGTRFRIRVDGDLRVLDHYDLSEADARAVARVGKVRAGLDIADSRTAQSGQFETLVGGQSFFVRVQTQPTIHGENLIMRLLPQDTSLQSIEVLGFTAEAEERYRRLLSNPGGLVLVVGPTGCGKTTTLYAGLRELARDTARKVISVEDPAEYVCAGVQQVEVSEELGFGFADAMRHLVREDPDVILLGEIRDSETALEAIRASQTGHLVLSTLHCNDATDAVQRLADLGMHPNSIASELLAVFAQRLAKRVCAACREPSTPSPEVAAEVFPDGLPDDFTCFTGRGCADCLDTGSYGRIAVVEMLEAGKPLRAAIERKASRDQLRAVAIAEGMTPMRERALELVRDGTIAFDTLPRFIPIDRLVPH